MNQYDDTPPDFKKAPRQLTDADPCGLKPYVNTPLRDVPVSYFEWMVLQQQYAPRVNRGTQWLRVMEWIKRR
jgi:hypothetical protein